jgi:hypothetical protein
MNKSEKIEKFIENNSLDFSGTGSDLNGNCVILAGYACYIGVNNTREFEDILDIFDLRGDIIDSDAWDKLKDVFNYAHDNNYGEWWTKESAKTMYKF